MELSSEGGEEKQRTKDSKQAKIFGKERQEDMKRMNTSNMRFVTGAFLSVLGGFLSIIDFTLVFAKIIMESAGVILAYLSVWYVTGVTLGLLVILGTLLEYRGCKTGKYMIMIPPLTFPLSFFLILLPKAGTLIPLLYYYPFVGSHWLLLSLIGGFIMLKPRKRTNVEGNENAQA